MRWRVVRRMRKKAQPMNLSSNRNVQDGNHERRNSKVKDARLKFKWKRKKPNTIFPSRGIFELSAWQHSPKVTSRVKMEWRRLGQLTTRPMIPSSNRNVHGKEAWKRNSGNKRRARLLNSHENENPPQYSRAGNIRTVCVTTFAQSNAAR